ncbi:NAD(+) diphosphatase [Pseudoprimorskyibacter insulae]|uniref:NAD(+) diphosphatase n=1 Tax=Pseudoprimorskyibacter insulae TaxID=1695997 RepID=A0A2R8APD3_9RHOB|nr:NAD(+) diphosphatase [Pseudoprimorskyibacter insulae]SPF77865.1 NADH pyrophosphatase [Pseudoprimorskyibacter insulae]
MRHAEQVTFGGSALDRAADLRGDIPALAAAMQSDATRAIVMWRGKPLIEGAEDSCALARLPLTHPVLAESRADPILLGREAGAAVFAYDISAWQPADLDADAMGSFLDQSEQVHPSFDGTLRFAELRRIMTRLTPRDAELAATAKGIQSWHATHGFCAKCGQPSETVQAGWQRTCPACGAQHFPRTDPVVIMLVTHGNKVLLGRSDGWPDGMYSCLAGFVEPGETIEAAVRREVWEEAGIKIGEVRYLASQPWPFPASLMFGCHGIATSEDITVDPNELEHAMWVSREDVMDAFAGNSGNLLPARKGAIAHFLLRNWLADRLS